MHIRRRLFCLIRLFLLLAGLAKLHAALSNKNKGTKGEEKNHIYIPHKVTTEGPENNALLQQSNHKVGITILT